MTDTEDCHLANRRKTQHRIQRDTNNQELAEVKRENTELKRRISRLRKEFTQTPSLEPENEEIAETMADSKVMVCPKCGSKDIGTIVTPTNKSVSSCRSCKIRCN